jgi:hypothetical protein
MGNLSRYSSGDSIAMVWLILLLLLLLLLLLSKLMLSIIFIEAYAIDTDFAIYRSLCYRFVVSFWTRCWCYRVLFILENLNITIKTSTLDYNWDRYLSSIINCVIFRLWGSLLLLLVCFHSIALAIEWLIVALSSLTHSDSASDSCCRHLCLTGFRL